MPEAERNRRGSVRELALSGGTVATARVFDVAVSYVFYIVLSRAVGVAAHDPNAFVAAIEACLDDTSDSRVAQRRLFASRADWTERLATMCGIVSDVL